MVIYLAFQIGSALLDACVLAVLAEGDVYGYKLTQELRMVVDVSESTLYPVLRRLQKDGAVEPYDQPYQGRNRRYYRLTGHGEEQNRLYREEWLNFKHKVDGLLIPQLTGRSQLILTDGEGEEHDKA